MAAVSLNPGLQQLLLTLQTQFVDATKRFPLGSSFVEFNAG